MFTILQFMYSFFSPFFSSTASASETVSVAESLVPLQFPLPDVGIVQMLHPFAGHFIFRALSFLIR